MITVLPHPACHQLINQRLYCAIIIVHTILSQTFRKLKGYYMAFQKITQVYI